LLSKIRYSLHILANRAEDVFYLKDEYQNMIEQDLRENLKLEIIEKLDN
jgi:UTP:GlnB (protein PII) uridylyltransferase